MRAEHQALPRRQRRATTTADLAAAYDDEHLMACSGCGVARPRSSKPVEPCPLCGGALRAWAERVRVPALADSLAAVAARLGRLATPASETER